MPARIDDDVRRRLASAVGDSGSLASESVVEPSSVEQLAAALKVCSDGAIPFEVTSGAQRGPDAAAVLISLRRLQRVAVDAGSLTVRAEAGAEVASLRATAEADGRNVVGLPGTTDARHVGGLIARGEVPRRSLTGIELVLSTGELVSCGGRILKDVAGYDVAAVVLGSLGRAAVIVAATFRVQPARAPAAAPAARRSVAGGSRALRALDPGGLLRIRA